MTDKMKIIKLKPSQYDYFRKLDTVFMLGFASVGNGFALGGIIHDEATDRDIPAVLMVCNQIKDTILIEWLCVDEDYRYLGLGSKMLDELISLSDNGGIKQVCAYFRDTDSRRLTCPGDKKYFREYGFAYERRLGGEWIGRLKTMVSNKGKKDATDNSHIVVLSDLSRFRIKEAVERIILDPSTDYSYGVDSSDIHYDEKLSILLMKDEEIVAGLLVDSNDRFLYPVCIMAPSVKEQRSLIDAALSKAAGLFNDETNVSVILKTDKYLACVEELLPGERMGNFILYSDTCDLMNVDEYRSYDYGFDIDPYDSYAYGAELTDYLKDGSEKVVTVGDLKGINRLKDFETTVTVEELGSIDIKDMYQILMDCRYGDNYSLFETIPLVPNLEWFDSELSCCIRIDGEIACIMLVSIMSDASILPLLLYSGSKKYAPYLVKLLLNFKNRVIAAYPADTGIILRAADEKQVQLYRSLLGDIYR